MQNSKTGPKLVRAAWILLIAIACGAVGWWAATTTMTPAIIPQTEVEVDTVVAVEGTVGRTNMVSVTLNQPVRTVATNTLSGVVSEIHPDGEKSLGEPLYAVAGTSVRVFEGATPFYRDLSQGDTGQDVLQLQKGLLELGFLKQESLDSKFGTGTTRAVKQWQKSVGHPVTGTISLGQILAVPQLPSSVTLGEEIVLGALVSGGEAAFKARTGEQKFLLVISSEQAQTITPDVTVRIFFEDHEWLAIVAQSYNDETGSVVMELSGPNGEPVCQDQCGQLPSNPQITLRAEAIVVPEVTGPAVPMSAVRTKPDGRAYVSTPLDGDLDITVLGSGQGIAVVEGLSVGQEVLLPQVKAGGSATTGSKSDNDGGSQPDPDSGTFSTPESN